MWSYSAYIHHGRLKASHRHALFNIQHNTTPCKTLQSINFNLNLQYFFFYLFIWQMVHNFLCKTSTSSHLSVWTIQICVCCCSKCVLVGVLSLCFIFKVQFLWRFFSNRKPLVYAGYEYSYALSYRTIVNRIHESLSHNNLRFAISDAPPVMLYSFIEQTLQPGPAVSLKCKQSLRYIFNFVNCFIFFRMLSFLYLIFVWSRIVLSTEYFKSWVYIIVF